MPLDNKQDEKYDAIVWMLSFIEEMKKKTMNLTAGMVDIEGKQNAIPLTELVVFLMEKIKEIVQNNQDNRQDVDPDEKISNEEEIRNIIGLFEVIMKE